MHHSAKSSSRNKCFLHRNPPQMTSAMWPESQKAESSITRDNGLVDRMHSADLCWDVCEINFSLPLINRSAVELDWQDRWKALAIWTETEVRRFLDVSLSCILREKTKLGLYRSLSIEGGSFSDNSSTITTEICIHKIFIAFVMWNESFCKDS